MIDRQFGAFRERVGALVGTAPGATRTSNPLLELTLAELQLAEEELQVCIEEIHSNRDTTLGGLEGDWRLLTKMFADLPVPVFLLSADGSIRRCNEAAVELMGLSQRYLSRRPLAVLIDLTRRSAYRTELSRVTRDGGTRSVPVRLAAHCGGRDVLLVLRRITLQDETRRMVIAVAYESVVQATPDTATRAGQTLDEARGIIANLRRALETRGVIGQATGILIVKRGLTAEKAFEVLVRASQHQNVKLSDLARSLVADPESHQFL